MCQLILLERAQRLFYESKAITLNTVRDAITQWLNITVWLAERVESVTIVACDKLRRAMLQARKQSLANAISSFQLGRSFIVANMLRTMRGFEFDLDMHPESRFGNFLRG